MHHTRHTTTTSESVSGVLVIDKPTGPTSHDLVKQARAFFNTKVGHTGTLDPMATGVLPLVLGRATRLAQFFQASDKEYLAEIRLGRTTDSFDREGKLVMERPVPTVSDAQVAAILERFTGPIRQRVPQFSAVKVGGKKLYELARRGCSPERPWREVSIYQLDLLQRSHETWNLRVHCSSGTYIRCLADEIGAALDCGGHLNNLRRVRSGRFDLERSIPLGEIGEKWKTAIYPMEELLPEMPRIDLTKLQARRVRHGNDIQEEHEPGTELFRLFHEQQLVAIGKPVSDHKIRPVIVLAETNETK